MSGTFLWYVSCVCEDDTLAHLNAGKFSLSRNLLHGAPQELALSLRPMQLAPEAVVFKEGEEGQCMYFVAKGQIELSMMLVVMRTHIDIVSLVLLLVNDLVNLYRFLRGNTGKITTSNVLTFALQYENR